MPKLQKEKINTRDAAAIITGNNIGKVTCMNVLIGEDPSIFAALSISGSKLDQKV